MAMPGCNMMACVPVRIASRVATRLALVILLGPLASPGPSLAADPQPVPEASPPTALERIEDPRISELLTRAEAARDRGWLESPPGRSALDLYLQVLEIQPMQAAAMAGLAAIQRALIEQAADLAARADPEAAMRLLERADPLTDDALLMSWARARIATIGQAQRMAAEQAAWELIGQGRFEAADQLITDLIAMGMPHERIDAMRLRMVEARLYGDFRPGQGFSDLLADGRHSGPAMVVIPAGQFMKGSPDSEPGRLSHEGPRYRVVFERGFALAQTECSVAEFQHFIESTAYRTDAERRGWSRIYDPRSGRMTRRNGIHWRHDYLGREAAADLPVIHVSWRDATAFAAWLAEQTGHAYRLPSEAEFEYALRAGTQTRYWWGDGSPDHAVENLTGDGDISPSNTRWSIAFSRYSDGFWGPAPVGSFKPNPFGLYDMGGNVMHWTQDCWHDSFVRAPVDGSAWINPGCTERVIRGGSWSSTPAMSRSAYRIAGAQDSSDMRLGFRVARDL